MMKPRKITPTKWADVKKRIVAAAEQAADEDKTIIITVASPHKSC